MELEAEQRLGNDLERHDGKRHARLDHDPERLGRVTTYTLAVAQQRHRWWPFITLARLVGGSKEEK